MLISFAVGDSLTKCVAASFENKVKFFLKKRRGKKCISACFDTLKCSIEVQFLAD